MVGDMAPESVENSLSVSTSAAGDHTLISVSGEVDAASADSLRSTVFDVIEGGQANVKIDMSDVSFIDSSGLRVLIAGYKAAESAGGGLSVAEPSEAVRRLLEITGQLERFVTA